MGVPPMFGPLAVIQQPYEQPRSAKKLADFQAAGREDRLPDDFKPPVVEPRFPYFPIQGVKGPDEESLRGIIERLHPSRIPSRVFVVPQNQWLGLTANSGLSKAESRFRDYPALSVRGDGRIYLRSDLLRQPTLLDDLLRHELGHLIAPTDNEEDADRFAKRFLQK